MYQNKIDITMAQEDLTTADAAQTTLEGVYEFCVSVPVEERKRLFKLGDQSMAFAYQILELAKINVDLLPRNLDLTAIERDMVAWEQLSDRSLRMRQLAERMEHTTMLLGSDFLGGTLAAYKALQLNGKAAGLEAVLADIGQRFAKRLKTVAEPTTPVPAPETMA